MAAGLALSGASAVLAAAALPPVGLWPLCFVAWTPMILAQQRVLPRQLAGLAWAAGIGGYLALTIWPVLDRPDVAWYMRMLPAAVAVGVIPLGWLDRRSQEATKWRWLALTTPLAWAGVEFVRSYAPVSGTWGWPADPLFAQAWLLQPVSVFGTDALNALVLIPSFALGAAILRRRVAPVALAAAALIAWTALSLALMHDPPRTARVAAVQPGAGHFGGAGDRRLLDRTRAAAAAGAQLVVWPEKLIPYDVRGPRGAWVRELARSARVWLAVGQGPDGLRGARNEAALISPSGHVASVTGKRHPVGFIGERSTTRGGGSVAAGELGRLAAIVCYDLDFTDSARHAAREGANVIAVPSFDWPAIAKRHYTHLVFRAVENRVAMVKAETAYDSAVVDPYGRLVARRITPDGRPATLVAAVAPGNGSSPFVTLGPWFGALCALWLGVYGVLCLRAAWRR